MTLNFPFEFSKESSNIKIHENLTSGRRVGPCGQTDRHDETNCRFSQFCERFGRRIVLHRYCNFVCLWHSGETVVVCAGFIVGKTKGKTAIGRPSCRLQNNIKLDIQEI
jgi:hypothetical protein